MNRTILTQAWLLSGIILSNYVAQIFYYLHLYYTPQHPLPTFVNALPLVAVFVLFLVSTVLFINQTRIGLYLLMLYLAMEFFFYLWNLIGGVLAGYALFFHFSEPDPVLWTVFAIGTMNFFASGYFLLLLLIKRRELLGAGRVSPARDIRGEGVTA